MKKIIEFFKQKDKQLHMIACLAITFVVGILDIVIFNRPAWNAAAIGFTAAMTVGFFKEAYDEMFKDGIVDVKDLFADFVGSIVGLGVVGGIIGGILTLFA